ncbi:Signal transduction histidine kinase [Pseudonocardia thermophila]|jgi:Signal transduction histidine kinase|uniref:histidine kinase n=2 Tax=Pseudonocardia thermophila TaxID=1848 RepID=A0A1M6RK54_PSETH|nr:Signal transduction histidine kinase [Pseudonocardia thermophila]
MPFAAVGAVVYAAITDPADPWRTAALVAGAALFGVWALRPDRMPAPVLTAGVSIAVLVAKGSGDLDPGMLLLSLLAIAVAGWDTGPATTAVCVLVAIAVPVLVDVLDPDDVDVGVWVAAVAFPALIAGLFRRQEEQRAADEAARAAAAARAAEEERRRIARDVHDLVGHGLAAVLLQVASARHVLHDDPAEADLALAAAEDSGRRGLTELRATVALLRSADGDDGDGRSPVPGLDGIARLVADARAGGLSVEHTTTGELRDVDPMAALTLYRIAQEALLNAARHAPDARTSVHVAAEPTATVLEVTSRPVRPARNRPGYGLTGMRERAAAAGGTLVAGPVDDGWVVRCALPGSAP